MRHNGSVAAEYVLILAFFAILAISNLDQIEDSIGGLEGSINGSLQKVNTLIPGAASGVEDS
jgi:Flp pilus assembly pilin Flp